MLVLARQRDQTIIIGDDIEITVVDIRGDKVRLGISAPREVTVHRKEVYDAIKRENRQAGDLQPADLEHAQEKGTQVMSATSTQPDPFMDAAIEEAMAGLKEGGLPIGSVLVRAGKIIARGHNRRVQHGDPMAHAEIDCLKNAGRQTTYKDTILYSTLMPCYLCTGAVVQFGIPKVIVGEADTFHGGDGKWGASPKFLVANGIEVVNLHDQRCIDMMTDFIKKNPTLWNEDIGK
jgi:cytosine/creatinine deaminase